MNSGQNLNTVIESNFSQHINVINDTIEKCLPEIRSSVAMVIDALKSGNKILFMGNGGSASDSQHLAAELVGRYKTDRNALPAIALTTDTSILTAVGNDFGFNTIFERQIGALAIENDLIIGISTSGNSENVIKGFIEAKKIGFTGKDGGKMKEFCDFTIVVPSDDTARIQEAPILIGHTICEIIDQNFS